MRRNILKKLIVVVVSLISAFCAFGCEKVQNSTAMNGSEIFDAYRSSVVEVLCKDKSGTAFVVENSQNKVVFATAYHVTGYDAQNVKFRFVGSDVFVSGATAIGYDVKHDVAFFEVQYDTATQTSNAFASLKPCSFSIATVKEGEKVYAIGNADGEGISIVDGIVSKKEDIVKYGASNYYKPLIRTSARVSSGNSGGALVNESGKVVGMTVASDENNYSKTTLCLLVLSMLFTRELSKTNKMRRYVTRCFRFLEKT